MLDDIKPIKITSFDSQGLIQIIFARRQKWLSSDL